MRLLRCKNIAVEHTTASIFDAPYPHHSKRMNNSGLIVFLLL